MKIRSFSTLVLAAGAAAALASCGGLQSGDSRVVVHLGVPTTSTASTRSTASTALDAAAKASGPYQHVYVDVKTVSIHSTDGSWKPLSSPNEVVDLLAFQGSGVVKTLADTTIPAGSYTELRLLLGPNNTVVDGNGTHDLVVPSGQQSGIKVPLAFQVDANTTRDLYLYVESVFVHETGNGKYMLRPVVHGYDRLETGAVTGTIAGPGGPLAGVEVTAQELDGTAVPTIAKTATTDANGAFVLDMLPVGHTFYVVSQPVVGATSYAPQAGGPFTISTTTAVPAWTPPAFTAASAVGAIAGALQPPATDADGDDVYALQTLAGQALVVRHMDQFTGLPSSEGYTMASLPGGTYHVVAERTTAGVIRAPTTGPVDAAVTNGGTAAANFTFAATPAP